MFHLFLTDPLAFLVIFPGLLLSLSIHEFAHAWTADKLGDPTPRVQGRVTLNPLAHLDPLGTLAMLLTRFGWGKPVQFDPYNLRRPLQDTAIIAAAGPATNLLIATGLSLLLHLGAVPTPFAIWLATILDINLVLALFNLIPVYPLDGSKIILALLPPTLAIEYEELMRNYGMFLLLLLIFPWASGASPASYLINLPLTLLERIFIP